MERGGNHAEYKKYFSRTDKAEVVECQTEVVDKGGSVEARWVMRQQNL